MDVFLPGLVMGFREGLEAFLIVVVILQYLKKSDLNYLKKNVYVGASIGVGASLVVGGILFALSNSLEKMEEAATSWESIASFVALGLITTFIYWMIKHGRNMVSSVETSVGKNLSAFGIAAISFIMVAREGVEIAIFTFAGQYTILSLAAGIAGALVLTAMIYFSLVKVNLRVLFNVTLGYLILQAGFLLGYGIHEGLSALSGAGILSGDSILLIKAFDLSGTVFYHKEGIIGLPLYVLLGWHSRPEILQFITQYFYTFVLFYIWYREAKAASRTEGRLTKEMQTAH